VKRFEILGKKKPVVSHSPVVAFFRFILYHIVAVPILGAIDFLMFGMRIHGRKNLRGLKGAVIVSNHIHALDCTMLAWTMPGKTIIFTSQPSNFQLPIAGGLIRAFGCVPIPSRPGELKYFFSGLKDELKSGHFVCMYPEGELVYYCSEIRDFKKGPFLLADMADVPILPVTIRPVAATGIRRFLKRKPLLHLYIGKPVCPDHSLPSGQRVFHLMDTVYWAMQDLLNGTNPQNMPLSQDRSHML